MNWIKYVSLLNVYDIFRDVNSGVSTSVGRGIGIRSDSDAGGEVESGDYGEIGLEVRGEVGSRYGRSAVKYLNGLVSFITDYILCWVVYRGVSAVVCIGNYGEINMSQMDYVWILMEM